MNIDNFAWFFAWFLVLLFTITFPVYYIIKKLFLRWCDVYKQREIRELINEGSIIPPNWNGTKCWKFSKKVEERMKEYGKGKD